MDTIALVDKYPAEDERTVAKEIVRSVGGPAAVASVTLSRLGIPTALVGTIGNDSDGDSILETLKVEGIDISGITRSEVDPTSGSVIVVSKSEQSRAISTRQPITQVKPNAAAENLIKNADWVHVDHVGIKQLDLIGIRRGAGAKISFDAGYGVKDFDVKRVDLFAPNDRQISERHPDLNVEEGTKLDSETGKNTVVTTMGSKGSIGYNQESGLVKAQPIKGEIISTLGAGDVFHGALLAQIIEGRFLQEALLRANIVAGLACRGLDGISAIPDVDELLEYIKKVEIK